MRRLSLFTALSVFASRLPLLLFDKLFLIALEPPFQFDRRFLQLIVVQQAAAQRFKERARAHVVSEFFVSFVSACLRAVEMKSFS